MGEPTECEEQAVTIIDYDPQWVVLYEEEKRRILEAVGDTIVEIEHIGSTAVPGLGAKPIIDMMVAVAHLGDAENCMRPLRSIGYEYVPENEASIPERRYFHKGHPPKEQHYHLHMVEGASDFWKKHLQFRDYLRSHPKVAREYYELKKMLVIKYRLDREAYTTGKTTFIESVITKAHSTK